jgi:CheY-like chemotaxis protein
MNAMRKVLVVDDDPVVSRSFDRVLSRKGYIVVSAENGLEALSKAAREEYDAVFTDIKIPGMDGIEVAQQMRARRPWTPVVIITGYGSAEHEARAEAAGVCGFLRKPLSPDMIESSLDAAIAEAAPVAEVLPQAGVAVVEGAVAASWPAAEETVGEVAGEARSVGQFVKNIALFFAAPFIALAYIALFPLIGMVMLARIAGQAWRHGRAAAMAAAARELAEPQPQAAGDASESVGTGQVLKNLAMFFSAPFVALAYIMLLPLIGLVTLAWTAGQAWRKRRVLG